METNDLSFIKYKCKKCDSVMTLIALESGNDKSGDIKVICEKCNKKATD